jgi:hypothetical protein
MSPTLSMPTYLLMRRTVVSYLVKWVSAVCMSATWCGLYVVESYYDHLLVYDDAGRFLLPVGGTGSDVGKFFLPAGAWSDRQDRIFIADMFNSRVVIFRYVGAES